MLKASKVHQVLFTFLTAQSINLWAEDVLEPISAQPAYEFWSVFLNMILMLGGILALLLGASWIIRKLFDRQLSFGSSSRRIQILEKRSLHAKACLYLLRVDNEEILAAESSEGIRTLAHWKHSEKEFTLSNSN